MKKLNIVFAGTPDIAAQVLVDLYASKHHILSVLTQPDKAKGRGRKINFSPVKKIALANNTLVLQAESLKKNSHILDILKKLKPDVIVVVAYGILIPKEFLDIPIYGCLNIHVSLLPKWRGAAPIQRAIQAGDKKTGICIMQMNENLDTGDILNKLEIDIGAKDTSLILHNKLSKIAIKPLLQTLNEIDTIDSVSQQGIATYAHKIKKEEGLIDFTELAQNINYKIRAFTPWPSAFFKLGDEIIKVGQFEVLESNTSRVCEIINISKEGFDIAAIDRIIRFKELQFPNKKMLNIADILNGKNLSNYIGYKVG